MNAPPFQTNTDPGDEQPVNTRRILDKVIPHEESDSLIIRRFACTFLDIEKTVTNQVFHSMRDLGPVNAFDKYDVTIVVSRRAS